MRGRILRRRRTSKQEAARGSASVHRPTDPVKRLRQALPLVDEHGGIAVGQAGRLGLGDDPLRLVVETVGGSCPLQGGRGLPDRARPLDRYSRETGEKLIEFIINGTPLVTGTRTIAWNV
jgi:hypothetical protein